MKIINTDVLLRELPEAWRDRYPVGAEWTTPDKEAIYQRLLQARNDESLTVELANKIIGNGAWTTVSCEECGEICDSAMRMAWDIEWDRDFDIDGQESDWPMICLKCLKEAAKQLEEQEALRRIEATIQIFDTPGEAIA